MTLNTFLSPLGKLKDLEIVSEEQFGIISSSPNITTENKLTLTDWIFNELTFINEIAKLKRKINKKIKVKHFKPSEVKTKSLDEVYGCIEHIDFDDEWDEISDTLLCKLINDFSNIYNERVYDFYNKKLNQLKINPTEIRRTLLAKIQLIEKKEDKVIFNEFLHYLKEFYFEPIVGQQQINIDESNKSKSNTQSQEKSSYESNDEDITVLNHPFQNLEILNFFLHIENKTSKKTKIFYSYFREFLISKDMFSDSNLSRQNYYDWINKEKNLSGKTMIQFQHNLSSEHDYFKTFESELKHYEKTIKPIPRIE